LCGELLEHWANKSCQRLKVVHVLSGAKDDASWDGRKGYINRELLEEYCPPVQEDYVFLCGPPAMYRTFCGPRDSPELTGVLKDMGYSADQVYKF